MDPGHVCSKIREHTSVAFPDPAKGGGIGSRTYPLLPRPPAVPDSTDHLLG